jgi:hypothetical protein
MFLIGLAEVELGEGHDAEALRMASIVRMRVNSGEKVAQNFKQRADALISRLGNTP